MRLTCLYCEREGRETTLIRIAKHWACCPIHSSEYLTRLNPIPAGYALVRKPEPELQARGRPSRDGKRT